MWFLITYNRPLLAQRFIEAAVSTGMTTPGVMFVQGDAKGYDFPMPKGWARAISATNIGLIRGLNTCLVQHKDAPWYGLLADDLLPETEGWDRKLLDQLHPMGIVSCNDGNRPFKGGACAGLLSSMGRWSGPLGLSALPVAGTAIPTTGGNWWGRPSPAGTG